MAETTTAMAVAAAVAASTNHPMMAPIAEMMKPI
jgi:hypothetical protein